MKARRTPDPIEAISQRHQALSERVHQGADPAELLPEAEQFILEIRQAGRSAPPGSRRDLLRSVASYWATYVYQHSVTGTYPTIELEPYLGPGENATIGRLKNTNSLLAGAAGLILLTIVCTAAVISLTRERGSGTTQPPTEIAGTPPTDSEIAVPSLTPEVPDFLPDLTETPVGGIEATTTSTQPGSLTAIPSDTPAIEETPVPEGPITSLPPTFLPPLPTATQPPTDVNLPLIGVEVTNLEEGQEVRPLETLSIQYTNLQPGWSVHLVLQSLEAGGRFFSVEDFYTVPEGASSGSFTVEVSFGQQGSRYNVTPVIAMTAEARSELVGSSQNGFSQLPDGVIPLPQVVTVQVGATERIEEDRLVYSSYWPASGRIEIVATRPDGTDLRQLTSAPNLNKLYPALSPSGNRIVFVGREFAVSGEVLESLWLVDADGRNPVMLLQESGQRFEGPAWSPDERTIAFGASPQPGSEQDWQIYLWDLASSSARLLDSIPAGSRFPSWTAGDGQLLFSAPSEESRTQAIFQIDVESGALSKVYDSPDNDVRPVMAPDGSRLAFISTPRSERRERQVYQLIIYDPASKQAAELWSQPSPLASLAWHPAAAGIYFESLSSGSYAIWMVSSEGGEAVQVTNGTSDRWPVFGFLSIFLPRGGTR